MVSEVRFYFHTSDQQIDGGGAFIDVSHVYSFLLVLTEIEYRDNQINEKTQECWRDKGNTWFVQVFLMFF